jgi:hypothetical protein
MEATFGEAFDAMSVLRYSRFIESAHQPQLATHKQLRLDEKDAKPGEEIWVLLTRHFVDRHRQTEYIAVNVQQDEALREVVPGRHTALRVSL